MDYKTDIFPTLCAYLHLPEPQGMLGQSLLPALGDARYRGRKSEYYIYANYQRGLRMGAYKLIEYLVKGRRHTQLFNLSTDPWEQRNLAGEKGMQKQLRVMHAEMKRWHQVAKDPMPVFYE